LNADEEYLIYKKVLSSRIVLQQIPESSQISISIDENSDVSSQVEGGFRDHYNKWHVVEGDDMMQMTSSGIG
jgi:hypothetical protein